MPRARGRSSHSVTAAAIGTGTGNGPPVTGAGVYGCHSARYGCGCHYRRPGVVSSSHSARYRYGCGCLSDPAAGSSQRPRPGVVVVPGCGCRRARVRPGVRVRVSAGRVSSTSTTGPPAGCGSGRGCGCELVTALAAAGSAGHSATAGRGPGNCARDQRKRSIPAVWFVNCISRFRIRYSRLVKQTAVPRIGHSRVLIIRFLQNHNPIFAKSTSGFRARRGRRAVDAARQMSPCARSIIEFCFYVLRAARYVANVYLVKRHTHQAKGSKQWTITATSIPGIDVTLTGGATLAALSVAGSAAGTTTCAESWCAHDRQQGSRHNRWF